MDINLKGIPDDLAARLADKAAAAGMSRTEYIRRILASDAERLSPTELLQRRSDLGLETLPSSAWSEFVNRS